MNCVKLRVLNRHKERRVRQVEEFSIGGVLKATFQVFGKNLVPFILLGLVIAVPTIFVQGWIARELSPLVASLASYFVNLLSFTLLQAVFVYGVFHTLRGESTNVQDILVQSVRVFPYAIFASVVAGLAIVAGTLLLIVPGIILSVMLWLAVPAAAIEKKRPRAALERSAELTKGHRWKVFGFLLLYMFLGMVAAFAIFATLGSFDPEAYMSQNSFAQPTTWVTWIFSAMAAVSAGVAYYDLRFLKEDMDSEAIGEVFD